jgi:hypothetical protein
LTAEAVCEPTKKQRTDRATGERERYGGRDVPDWRIEGGRDLAQHEHHDEEVEGIQGPPEVGGKDGVELAL